MANLTLADARTNVAQLLDDPNNRRWTTTQIDVALSQALSACMSAYTTGGGAAFDLETQALSTTSAGLCDLTTIAPVLFLKTVQLMTGSGTALTFQTVKPAQKSDRWQQAQVAYALALVYVRDYRIPSNTAHPLVGVGATEAASWPDFERWICADAASQLGVKDNDQRPMLQALEAKAKANVLDRLNTPRAYPLSPPKNSPLIWRNFSFTWNASPSAPSLQLVRSRSDGWFGSGGGSW